MNSFFKVLEESSQEELRHLKWMLQKDLLGQDIFLVGGPGPRRRSLALAFLELTGREVEYISLSRDTTEADLKQRREIESGTANYKDQGAVRAAVNGRVLVLEGVEKAERNVLPVLNNLLENREMHLEDGRFLVPASRYDKLLLVGFKETRKRFVVCFMFRFATSITITVEFFFLQGSYEGGTRLLETRKSQRRLPRRCSWSTIFPLSRTPVGSATSIKIPGSPHSADFV